MMPRVAICVCVFEREREGERENKIRDSSCASHQRVSLRVGHGKRSLLVNSLSWISLSLYFLK
jgi:hypothetical protein